MDTISRESTSSPLPIVGVIAGLLALVLAAIALVKVSSTGKRVGVVEQETVRIADIENSVKQVQGLAQSTAQKQDGLYKSVSEYITPLFQEVKATSERVAKLEETAKKAPVPGITKAGTAPATAGPGEYIVKAGDTFTKIAAATGTTVAAIEAANPGVSSGRLMIGQKIKLPGAQTQQKR